MLSRACTSSMSLMNFSTSSSARLILQPYFLTLLGASHRSRSKHDGRRIVVRERHQRPRVKDLGTKWKIFYWDYSSGKRCAHTKSWAKNKFPSWAEAQR